MNKLIKFQIRTMFQQKFYYVCLLLFVFMYPILDFINVYNKPNYESIKVMPQIVNLLSGGGTILSIIFIALFCCLDFNEGTTKNIISRGYSKTQLLFSKYIVSLFGVVSFYAVSFIVILCLFGINGLGYENIMLYSIINSIVRIITYTTLYASISFVFEKNSSAIIACLFIPSIIQSLLSLIDSKFHIEISKYWIDNISSEFLTNANLANLNYSLIFYTIYIIVFIALSINIIKRKEIK